MFNKLLDEAQAGENVGVLLRGIEKNDIERGMVLALLELASRIQNLKERSMF